MRGTGIVTIGSKFELFFVKLFSSILHLGYVGLASAIAYFLIGKIGLSVWIQLILTGVLFTFLFWYLVVGVWRNHFIIGTQEQINNLPTENVPTKWSLFDFD